MQQLSRQLAQRAQSVCIQCLQRSSATMIYLAVVLVWRTYALYGKSKKVLIQRWELPEDQASTPASYIKPTSNHHQPEGHFAYTRFPRTSRRGTPTGTGSSSNTNTNRSFGSLFHRGQSKQTLLPYLFRTSHSPGLFSFAAHNTV